MNNAPILIKFPEQQGSLLAVVAIIRKPDGQVIVDLRHMNMGEIETHDSIAARFDKLAEWMRAGADSLPDQALLFGEY